MIKKKILEFLGISTPVGRYPSEHSQFLDIYEFKGVKRLDSPKANYSYGSLYQAFQHAFSQISFGDFHPQKVLLLGLGAGCLLELLEKYFEGYTVEAVELDPVVIQLAYEHFDIQRFKNLHIIQADARDWIKNLNTPYDFILIDLFIDLNIPDFLFEEAYWELLCRAVTSQGYLLINTIPKIQDNSPILNALSARGRLTILERYRNFNEMLLWQP